MSQSLLNKKVQNAFSKASDNYENMTNFHKQIAWRLLNRIKNNKCIGNILDVGMGTGFFTEKLPWFIDNLNIVGIDFSYDMILKARNINYSIDIVQADATRLPFKDSSFNTVVSNLAYQWVDELLLSFKEMNRVLCKGGSIFLTMFGYNTFKELFFSLEKSADSNAENQELPIKRLHNHHQVAFYLKKAGFSHINIKYEQTRIRFKDIFDLLRWAKNIGANALDKNMYVGKDLLKKANEYYCRNFEDGRWVYSTFEIIWVEANKSE